MDTFVSDILLLDQRMIKLDANSREIGHGSSDVHLVF